MAKEESYKAVSPFQTLTPFHNQGKCIFSRGIPSFLPNENGKESTPKRGLERGSPEWAELTPNAGGGKRITERFITTLSPPN